jgi:predicted hydrolase (HD superfamily)
MNVDEARSLMHEWTASEALRVHMECVAACMGAYAEKHEPDEKDRWIIAGLLHDFDYEKHPTLDQHPQDGVAWLRENTDLDEDLLKTILAHAPHTGELRDTIMKKVIFAVDELAGFIVACAKVRPNGIDDMKAKSVVKKLKDKAFAAAVSREDINQGIQELGVDRSEHIQFCIDAIRSEADRLSL